MAKPELVLIGNYDRLLVNLAKPFIRSGFGVTVVTPSNTRVSSTKGLTRFVEIPRDNEIEFLEYLEGNPAIIADLSGTFIWCSDSIMNRVFKSKLPETLKNRVLPVGNSGVRKILGSKSGQVEFFKECGVVYPSSFVVSAPSDFIETSKWQVTFVKGDRLGRGVFVREYEVFTKDEIAEIPQDWYPLTLQEKMVGDFVSVEAFYANGNLVCWMYSISMTFDAKFGNSTSRIYKEPESLQFLETLEILGRAGSLNGPVNTSFIRESSTGNFYIFEFDARPTVWHHLWEFFNLPLLSAWSGELTAAVTPKLDRPVRVYEPSRVFEQELAAGRPINALKVLFRSEIKDLGIPVPSAFYDRSELIRNFTRAFSLLFSTFTKKFRSRILNPLSGG